MYMGVSMYQIGVPFYEDPTDGWIITCSLGKHFVLLLRAERRARSGEVGHRQLGGIKADSEMHKILRHAGAES